MMRGYNIEDIIEEYGEPVLRKKITDMTEEQRIFADIPGEIALFETDHPGGCIVYGKLSSGRWIPNYGERSVIKMLLEALPEIYMDGLGYGYSDSSSIAQWYHDPEEREEFKMDQVPQIIKKRL